MPADPVRRGPAPVGDAAATADALLAAGRRVFAECGYEAASVRRITAEAGATLGAITYHFGSKQGLYDRVIESSMVPLADRVAAAARGEARSLDRVEAVVREYLRHLLEHPELPRLLLHQLLRAGAPPAAAVASIWRVQEALTDLVAEGQADGSIRPGPPALLAIGIVSHPLHLGLLRGPMAAKVGVDLEDPGVRATAIENAALLARQGLAALPESDAGA